MLTRVDAGLTFMRCDTSQLPLETQNLDPAIAAYNGMQIVDVSNSHPIKWAFIDIMTQRMKDARRERRSTERRLTWCVVCS